MCKEADEEAPVQETKKVKIPKGLPEPGTPVNVPKEAMFPPLHDTGLANKAPTISAADTFADRELSSISDS